MGVNLYVRTAVQIRPIKLRTRYIVTAVFLLLLLLSVHVINIYSNSVASCTAVYDVSVSFEFQAADHGTVLV